MIEPKPEEWVIEVYTRIGWALSTLNTTAEPHTLDWCMGQWRKFKERCRFGEFHSAFNETQQTTDKDHYRLRNIRTEDTIMGAIL